MFKILRSVKKPNIREIFLHSAHVENRTTGETIGKQTLEILKKHDIIIKDDVVNYRTVQVI